MNVNIKYLKDEGGNIFSPVVSTDTVYNNSGVKLTECIYGTVLYDNPVGAGDVATITLYESVESYEFIEIYYYNRGNSISPQTQIVNYTKVFLPEGQIASLMGIDIIDTNSMQVVNSTYQISKNTLTLKSHLYANIIKGQVSYTGAGYNNISIFRVTGYKYR